MFARLPEPNACPFCLMLAAEPRYKTRESARGKSPYHDRCKCVPIEVKSFDDLPQINKDLYDEWTKVTWDDNGPVEDQQKVWTRHMNARIKECRGGVRWSAVSDIRTPEYKNRTTAQMFGDEPLPDLTKMPGHVLYGWTDKPKMNGRWISHLETSREGHTHDAKRPGSDPSRFPADWSHQKIVDAVRDTVEDPDGGYARTVGRIVWKEIDRVTVKAEYSIVNGKSRASQGIL